MLIKNSGNEQMSNLITKDKSGVTLPSTTVKLQTAGSGLLKDSASLSSQPQYNYGTTVTINILNESSGSFRQRQEQIAFNFSNFSIPPGQIVIDSQLCLNMTANDIDAGENANVSVYMVYDNWTVTNMDMHVAGNSNSEGFTYNSTWVWVGDVTDVRIYRYDATTGASSTSFSTSGSGNADIRGVDFIDGKIYAVDYSDAEIYLHGATNGTSMGSFDTLASGNANPVAIAHNSTHIGVTDITDAEIYWYTHAGSYASSCDTAGFGSANPRGIEMNSTNIMIIDPDDDLVYVLDLSCNLVTSITLSEDSTGNGAGYSIRINNGAFQILDNADARIYNYSSTWVPQSYYPISWAEGVSNGASNSLVGGYTYAKRTPTAWRKTVPEESKPFYTVATSPLRTWYCWNVTNASQYAYTNNYQNLTFYILADRVTTNELTDAINFMSKEGTSTVDRPYLNVTYDTYVAPSLTLNFNTTNTTFLNNSHYGPYLLFTWNNSEGLNMDYCKLEWNGTTNYSGTASGSNCNYNLSTIITSGNYTFRAWANSTTGIENFTGTYTVLYGFTKTLVDGYWVARAPLNTTNQFIGTSAERRYKDNIGSGYDIGVLWRASTDDTMSRNATDLNTDEKRHCGAWTQFMFDEPNITAGNITQMYCHTWNVATSMTNVVHALAEGDYAGSIPGQFIDGTDVYWANLNATPGNASEFYLGIYYQNNLNAPFYSNASFWNMSLIVSGTAMQTLTYKDQRTWCIFNKLNGTMLNDSDTLDLQDSDGDSLSDYDELFGTYTDPTVSDTDGDGFSDLIEYNNGKKGWNPDDWGTIYKYKLNVSTVSVYNKTTAGAGATEPTINILDTLTNEITSQAYDNITNLDAITHPHSTIGGTGGVNWSLMQQNYHFNVTQDLDSIDRVKIFVGNKRVTSGTTPTSINTTKVIYNFTNSGYKIIPNGIGNAQGVSFLKLSGSEVNDVINATGFLGVETAFLADAGTSTTSTLDTDWVELWVVVGGDYITLTSPSQENPLTTSSGEEINVSFKFYESGNQITNGVGVENITIGTDLCPLNNLASYNGTDWVINCTVPALADNTYNITIYANTTSANLHETDDNAIIIGSVCWTYDASNKFLKVPSGCRYDRVGTSALI